MNSKPRKAKKRSKPSYNVSAVDFVTAWASSSSITEVMKKTGLPRNTVYSRVNSYRRKKVVLSRFARPKQRLDIDALNAIAQKAKK